MSSSKISSIIVWNVAGLFVRPKYMTSGSNKPRLVRNAAFHSSPSLIQTLLKPQRTSNLVKYFAPQSFAINSGMSGSGYLFFMVIAFNGR